MPVDVTAALRDAVNRTVQRNGLVLAGVLLVLSAINGFLGVGIARWVASQEFTPVAVQAEPTLVVPPILAGVLSLLIGIATIVVSVAAIRLFVSEETERLPRELFTRRMGWAVLNYVVGSIVFGIVVALGFVALIIPGLFLLVTLAFWAVYVAVEDENFLTGFRRSWGLTRGHRLRLFALGVVVVVVSMIVSAVFGVGGLLGGDVGVVLAQVGGAISSAITTVFTLAALAAAYNQLVALSSEDENFAVGDSVTPPEDNAGTV